MKIYIPYLYLALFSPIASVHGTSTADCIDSSLPAVLDGSLPVDIDFITCSEFSSVIPTKPQLSELLCNGQSLNEHCPVTCMSCVNVCDDSNAIFILNSQNETCTSVAENITKCILDGVTETCRGTCEYCPTAAPSFSSTSPSSSPSNVPSLVLKVEELESRLNEQESSQTELESRLNEQDSSQTEVESRLNETESLQTELESRLNEQESSQTEVESRLNETESSQTEVESRLNEQESSIATVCNELAGYSYIDGDGCLPLCNELVGYRYVDGYGCLPVCNELVGYKYIDGYGCLPYTSRNGEEMVYFKNTSAKTWDEHQESAISCSGKLADIFDENESEQVYSLMRSEGQLEQMYIGGYQEQPCEDEPSGCWTWSDGTNFTYTNWRSDQPNDNYDTEDCLMMWSTYQSEWNDFSCFSDFQAAYILPTTFNDVSDCNIIPDF